MSRIKLVLEFDRYVPKDSDPFRRKGGGWLTEGELKDRISESLDKVISMMDVEDQMTITIEVTPEEEGNG